MIDPDNPTWVAVMTYPNAEASVANHFREDLGLECYLPMMHNRDKRFKRNTAVEKPMFPSYLFARITSRQVYNVRSVKGVYFIVSSKTNGIIPVPQRDIDTVHLFEETQRKFFIHDTAKLVKGASATMLDGDFAGMEGRLVKNCKDGNFCVTIESTHVSFVMRVRRDELKPAEAKQQVAKKYNF